jgi:hypothetical protein
MPSDTFGDAIKTVQAVADRIRESIALDASGEPDGPYAKRHMEEADRIAQAARLLEAAGRECRAGRSLLNDKGQAYINGDGMLREMYRSDRAALDALAPELKEVGR